MTNKVQGEVWGKYKNQRIDPVALIQAVLDIVGVFDPSGAADGLNAGIYASKGDIVNAAISGIAAGMPFVGDAAKLERFGLKAGSEASELISKEAIHEEVILYRGFDPENSVHAKQLVDYESTGYLNPRGGNATELEHVLGDTKSNYTSWTRDPEVAKRFAGPQGTVLSVNASDLPNRKIPAELWSPFYWERGILIEGPINLH